MLPYTRQSWVVGSFFFGRFLELLGGFLAHDSVPVGGGLQFPEFFSRSLCIVKKNELLTKWPVRAVKLMKKLADTGRKIGL